MKRFGALSLLTLWVVMLFGCKDMPSNSRGDCEDVNKAAIVEAIEVVFEAQNTLNFGELDGVLSPDFRRKAPDVSTDSRDEYKAFITRSRNMFSAYDMQIKSIATNADGGFVRWRFLGVYIGPGSKAGGSDIDVTGLAQYIFEDGKLTHEFIGFNPGWFQAQISPDAELLVKP